MMAGRAGISPVVSATLLVLIAIGMAGSATYFIQTQQESVSNELSGALGEGLVVDRMVCNGGNVSVLMRNDRDERLQTGRADIRVRQGGEPLPSFTNKDLAVTGPFLNPEGKGWANLSVGDAFVSGERYTVSIAFPASDYDITQQCEAGQSWWDLDWLFRRQVVMEASNPTGDVYAADFEINLSQHSTSTKFDCGDVRMVNESQLIDSFAVTECNLDSPALNTSITAGVPMDSSPHYSLYIYYGNLGVGSSAGGFTMTTWPSADSVSLGPVERVDE